MVPQISASAELPAHSIKTWLPLIAVREISYISGAKHYSHGVGADFPLCAVCENAVKSLRK